MAESTLSWAAEIADPGTFTAFDTTIESSDPVAFPGYADQLAAARSASTAGESVIAGNAVVGGIRVELAEFDFGFMGGSMGEAAGERLARAMERAERRRVPFVARINSGGARMQEGMAALVQMPKLVAARLALASARQPVITILANPSTGGILASLGALGDVVIAETGATVGFAGPRVVERFTGRRLQESSHRAESALAAGLVDDVVGPEKMKATIAHVLQVLADDTPAPIAEPRFVEPDALRVMDSWANVSSARAETRPRAPQLVRAIGETGFELRGDRSGSDDVACITSVARCAGRRVIIIAMDRRYSPRPGAYRKARRCMNIAARLSIPVVTLIDTRGADPSESSEAEGVAWEIAATFERMLALPVPVVNVVTGEGGSGGALALACGDVLLAFEHAIFSVIGPELAAEILWRAPERAPEAARGMRVGAADLLRLGIADAILPEPLVADSIRGAVAYHLDRLAGLGGPAELVAQRRARWRRRYAGKREEGP